jgi:hypothetical protein
MVVLRIVVLVVLFWAEFGFAQINDSVFYKNQVGLSISKIFRSTIRDNPFKIESLYKRFVDNKNYYQLAVGYEKDKGFLTLNSSYSGSFLRIGKFKSFSPKLFKKKRSNLFNVGINLFANSYNQSLKIKPDGYYVNSVFIYKNINDYNLATELEFSIKLMHSAKKRISLETTQRIGYLIKRPVYYYLYRIFTGICLFQSR